MVAVNGRDETKRVVLGVSLPRVAEGASELLLEMTHLTRSFRSFLSLVGELPPSNGIKSASDMLHRDMSSMSSYAALTVKSEGGPTSHQLLRKHDVDYYFKGT